MKKPIYISMAILLTLCLTGCAFHADKDVENKPAAEATKKPGTDKNTKTSESPEETATPSESPTQKTEAATAVSILEHLTTPEFTIDEEYDREYHYTDTTLGALESSSTVISGIYMDGNEPYIIADNPFWGRKMRYYRNETGGYGDITKVESKEFPWNCTEDEIDKINASNVPDSDSYLDKCCKRIGANNMGGYYLFTQNRVYPEASWMEKPVDFLDFPALWLFNEKGEPTKRISWARLTGIEKLQKETTKLSKHSAYYPCAYVISDTMWNGMLYFTFTVIDSAGKNKETHAYYYASLDVESETMLSCEEIDFDYPKIYGDYLVGITPDYKKIVVQNTKTGKKKKVKNTAGKHILSYALRGTTVYWMDMDTLYWKDISSDKKGTQPMNLREAIGDNTLMHNNPEEGWEEVAESIKTESCARNSLIVSEDGKLYGVFWSYPKLDAETLDESSIEVCFCNYMVLKFEPAKDSVPASPDKK